MMENLIFLCSNRLYPNGVILGIRQEILNSVVSNFRWFLILRSKSFHKETNIISNCLVSMLTIKNWNLASLKNDFLLSDYNSSAENEFSLFSIFNYFHISLQSLLCLCCTFRMKVEENVDKNRTETTEKTRI